MFDSSKLMYQSGGGFYDHEIEQSLRFNDDDSAYLSWTPASAGNRKTWTWSGWVKRGNLGTGQCLFQAGQAGGATSGESYLIINSDNTITLYRYTDGIGIHYQIKTTQVFRDSSSWYHIVAVWNTTSATSSDRLQLWINGERVTAFSTATYPPLDYNDGSINHNSSHQIAASIGYLGAFGNPLDGYLAEVHFIDGTALAASSFGETKSGVWIPKAYSGSYGTNGFYLDFGNSGSIGADVSGNGNNFTANNLAATDVVLDSPTNNFATLNPLQIDAPITFSEGNLKTVTTTFGNWSGTVSTVQPQEGKWYAEFCPISGLGGAENCSVGIYQNPTVLADNFNGSTGAVVYFDNGNIYVNGSLSQTVSTYTNGDIVSIALNMDSGTVQFYKNGSSVGTAETGISGNTAYCVTHSTYPILVANFGQDSSFAGNKTAQGNTDDNGYGDFYYAPPTGGYLALCTANLTLDAAMDPINGNSPQDYFNTVLYTGTGTTNAITGVGFQPDWVWVKRRSAAGDHILSDAVRTAGKYLSSNLASAEVTSTDFDSFDSDGFTVNAVDATGGLNVSGNTYVAWNWKANGSGVSNTDGSITSTVSANTDAGFSIVSWSGNNGVETIGHGLTEPPEIIIRKSRTTAAYWVVTGLALGSQKYMYLNLTNAAATYAPITDPTSTVFNGWGTDSNAPSMIAYCFHSVDGFSKFGSYTGNGSTDGTFVYTGFRPAYLLTKRIDSAGGWHVFDSVRGDYNPNDPYLYPHLSNAEYGGVDTYDLLSNGFKNTRAGVDQNASGGTYIYMAFAENPFKYANAR